VCFRKDGGGVSSLTHGIKKHGSKSMCRGLQAFCRHCVRCHYTNEGHSRYKKYQRVRFWKNKIIAYRVRCAFAYRSASCVEWHFSLIYSHRSHDWGEKKHFQLPPQHFPSAICILREKSVHTYKRVMRKKNSRRDFCRKIRVFRKKTSQRRLFREIRVAWKKCFLGGFLFADMPFT